MYICRVFVCVVLLLCGQVAMAMAAEPRVVGGLAVTTVKPWMAELELSASGNPNYRATLCGGTLIAPQWVVTAAHCVTNDSGTLQAGNLFVSLGAINRSVVAPEVLAVREVIVHPGYTESAFLNDIALLKLASASDYQPLDLAKPSVINELASGPADEALEIFGWGSTLQSGSGISETLQSARLDYITTSYCASRWGRLGSKQICAGEMNPQGTVQDSCRGDSGGPLVYDNEDGEWLVGVTSYGHKTCATSGVPAVYTRVDRYLDWLEATTNGALVDLKAQDIAADSYLSVGQTLSVVSTLVNNSEQTLARNVGLIIEHDEALEVSVAGLNCQLQGEYTECRSSRSLSAGGQEQRYYLALRSNQPWAGEVSVRAVSDAHDYFNQDSETLTVVFSNEPNVVLSLTTSRGADGLVRVRAVVENEASHQTAARVRVGFSVPAGWSAQIPENCYGSSTVQCGLGDMAPGAMVAQQIVLEGAGNSLMQVQVWTDNGDFPDDDTQASTRPALARSAVSAAAATSGTGTASTSAGAAESGSGGGGSLSWWWLSVFAAVAVRRRFYQ